MRHSKMVTATVLSAFLAAVPFAASGQSKTEETKDKAKSMTHDATTAVSDETWRRSTRSRPCDT